MLPFFTSAGGYAPSRSQNYQTSNIWYLNFVFDLGVFVFEFLGASFSSFGCFVFDLGCFVFEIWGLCFWVLGASFRVLGASFSRFGCFVFEIWGLRFWVLGASFRVLGASFSRLGCFVLRSLFSSASFSKLPHHRGPIVAGPEKQNFGKTFFFHFFVLVANVVIPRVIKYPNKHI